MAWRYRKYIKIAPGVKMNLSKGGVSATFGGKGASVSVGKNGAYLNTGIPGTGLYNRQKLFSNKKRISTRTSSNSDKSTLGCLFKGWGYFSLFMLIGGIIMLIKGDIELDKGTLFSLVFFLLCVLCIFGGKYVKSNKREEDDVIQDTPQKDSFSDPSSQNVEFKITENTTKGSQNAEVNDYKDKLKQDINELNTKFNSVYNAISLGYIDPKLLDVADIVVREQTCTASLIQRKFAIGYLRTISIIDQLEQMKVVRRLDKYRTEVLVKDRAELESILACIKYEGISENIFDIKEEYFNDINVIIHSIVRLFQEIKKDDTIMYAISDCLPKEYGNKEQKLAALFLADIMKVHQHFGHSITNLKNKEGFAIVLLSSRILADEIPLDITFGEVNKLEDLSKEVPSVFSSLSHVFDQYPDENFFFMGQVLNRCRRRSFYTRYFTLLYRLFSFIAKADGVITKNEDIWLKKLLELNPQKDNVNIVFNVMGNTSYEPIVPKEETKNEDTKEDTDKQDTSKETPNIKELTPIEELNNLIGLSNVKTEISSLSNLVNVQLVRKSRGMPVSNVSYHCVFTGNPGTGKTTVARIVAEIYKELGVLKKGHLIETDRSGLVGEYVGQTAPKTNAIINSALDGVLFIDEAYSLVQGGQSDYGMEAISTLLKRMEDDRDRLVVILAGYSKEMEDFINANSGLQSRFNRYIEFPDYSSNELMQIFNFIAKNSEYNLSEEAAIKVASVIDDAVSHKDANFGNARYVRNLFEKIITQQANRISAEPQITNDMLAMIEEIDIINAVKS